MKYVERAHPLHRAASDAARSGERSRGETVLAWLLAAPVALPLVVWGGLIYPYLVPKVLLFYALSFLAFGAFLVLVAYRRPFHYARLASWSAWIPGLLLALAYLASIFGIDFYRSFWSLYVRGDGLLMTTCAVADFYLILLYAERTFFDRMLRAVAVTASAVALYGIGEWLFAGGRVGSLLGNAAFFAGYLGITFFATLLAAESLSRPWRRAAYVGASLQALAIVLTATRGTMLALLVAGFTALAYFAWKGEGRLRRWSAWALSALVLFAGAFFLFRGQLAKVPFEPVSRIATIGTHDSDVASRLFIWRNMLGQIARHPLLGVGAEHIDVLFNEFYDPSKVAEDWFDRSHNAFLDYAAQYGIFGLALYLALISSFLFAALRLRSLGSPRLAGLTALLALTYAVQNFFVFDTVSSFWLLLALLALLIAAGTDSEPVVAAVPSWIRGAAWGAALVLVLLLYPVSVKPALAAYDLAHAYAYQKVDPAKTVAYLKDGFALGTYGSLEYGYEAYDIYANDLATYLSGQPRADVYAAVNGILGAQFDRFAYDARTALYYAHVLSLAPPEAPADQKRLSAALARTITESPKRLQPWYILANLSITSANAYPVGSAAHAEGYAAARDILSRYIALVPSLPEPHFVLAQLDMAEGRKDEASAQAEEGKRYYPALPGEQAARRAVSFYEGRQDWADARFFLKEVARFAPTDYASLYDLAKVTYLSGDPASALAEVEELRQTDPGILATDQNFLAAITAYERSRN